MRADGGSLFEGQACQIRSSGDTLVCQKMPSVRPGWLRNPKKDLSTGKKAADRNLAT
jgi:hypothetical protein